MGFLKDLKADWSQAVNELLPEEELLDKINKEQEKEVFSREAVLLQEETPVPEPEELFEEEPFEIEEFSEPEEDFLEEKEEDFPELGEDFLEEEEEDFPELEEDFLEEEEEDFPEPEEEILEEEEEDFPEPEEEILEEEEEDFPEPGEEILEEEEEDFPEPEEDFLEEEEEDFPEPEEDFAEEEEESFPEPEEDFAEEEREELFEPEEIFAEEEIADRVEDNINIEERMIEPEEDVKMAENEEMYEGSNVEKDLLNQLLEKELEAKATQELQAQAVQETEPEEAFVQPEETPVQSEETFVQPEEPKRAEPIVDGGDTTIIAKGTVINGSITSDGSLDVMGTITGDIDCLGKLSIVGNVSGSSTASEIYVNTNRLEGNLTSRGSVKIGVGTIIVGDISGTSAVIAGAVKGGVDVNGPVIVDSTAIVKGNINAKSVQINNGAVVDGYCSLTYSDVDLDNFFGGEN